MTIAEICQLSDEIRTEEILNQEPVRGLQHYKSRTPESRFFAAFGSHVGLRGRYWWASESANDQCTAHGGLSLAEALVPILNITRDR